MLVPVVVSAGLRGLWSAVTSGAVSRFESMRLKVVRTLPHDTDAFTQGLLWHQEKLYESTGQYRESRLRRLETSTGRVEKSIDLAAQYFGEGLARVGDRLIQLTWQEQTALVYDLESFDLISRYDYKGEGWGLCFDGKQLVMSDGSDILTFRDPGTFQVRKRLPVTLRGVPLSRLNELEWAEGAIWANVWERDFIVRIDPGNGRVTASVDASNLLSRREALRADVLNGIAYNPRSKTFFVTGKLWPKIFEVRFETH